MSSARWVELLAQLQALAGAYPMALLLADQRRCWLRGERVPAETYRERPPRLQADDELFPDVV